MYAIFSKYSPRPKIRCPMFHNFDSIVFLVICSLFYTMSTPILLLRLLRPQTDNVYHRRRKFYSCNHTNHIYA